MMTMTWFDVLLITLLALITAMGVQRGLAGLVWGVGAALICLGCNFLPALPAILAALVLGGALAYVTQLVLVRRGDEVLWERLLGGVGALIFGLVLIASLSLGFPAQKTGAYPSKSVMPPALYDAVAHSAVQAEAREWLGRSPLLRRWLTPDELGRKL